MLSSASDEANYIAHQFRSAHLRQGVPWSQMAVILRSPGAQVAALQRAFAMNSIPVEVDAIALSLADNPAIKPIITLAQIVIGQLKLIPSNWDQIEQSLGREHQTFRLTSGRCSIIVDVDQISFPKFSGDVLHRWWPGQCRFWAQMVRPLGLMSLLPA